MFHKMWKHQPASGECFTKCGSTKTITMHKSEIKDADHSCDWPVSNPNFLPTLQRMTDFLKEQKFIK